MEIDNDYIKTIARLESDIRHINIHIEEVKTGMTKIQDLILEQNDMRNELSVFLREHTEIKRQQGTLDNRLKTAEDRLVGVEQKVDNFGTGVKVSIFDYVWKYAALAIGGWVALQIAGILP